MLLIRKAGLLMAAVKSKVVKCRSRQTKPGLTVPMLNSPTIAPPSFTRYAATLHGERNFFGTSKVVNSNDDAWAKEVAKMIARAKAL